MTTEPPIQVIIVDDDRETREMLALTLESEGFTVRQAANGLKLISTLHVDHPNVILMDVNMSWIDGFELCRAVRSNSELGSIPIVFISARASDADVSRGLEAGANDYFVKPLDLPRLIERIQQLASEHAH